MSPRLAFIALLLLAPPFVFSAGLGSGITGFVVSPEALLQGANLSGNDLEMLQAEKMTDGAESLLSQECAQAITDAEARARADALLLTLEQGASGSSLLKGVASSKLEKFLIQFNKSCDLSGLPSETIKHEIVTDDSRFIVLLMPRDLLGPLVEQGCVIKIADADHQDLFFAYAHRVLDEEVKRRAKDQRLADTSTGVSSYAAATALAEESWAQGGEKSAALQRFVTPQDERIARLALGMDPLSVYSVALGWPWVSDNRLWGETERWLTPERFLSATPLMNGTPFPGSPSSDCEEHANTLVSLLRASGISPKEVRVAIGIVTFDDGKEGGHAWAEVRINGTWTVLDSTTGRYFDDARQNVSEREGVSFDYWKYHSFPIKEVWAYYNDVYFLDLRSKNAPSSWKDAAGTRFDSELGDALKMGLWERFLLFLLRLLSLFF